MGAAKQRWKGPLSERQTLEDTRDLLLVIAKATTAFDSLDREAAAGQLRLFVARRREDIPGDGH